MSPKCYFAPLEGLTDSYYRRLHARYFGGVDKYYTPFFSPTVHRALTPREARELPVQEEDFPLTVPQMLTKDPEDFLWMAEQCAQRGYREINLNLGCPSGTVTAKGKGAGMLRDPEALIPFLDEIFRRSPLPVSVKTRLGMDDDGAFPRILQILDGYPIAELTVHPRLRSDYYTGDLRMEWFAYAAGHFRHPICYNGNLTGRDGIRRIQAEYPRISAVMLGRGLIGDPGMLCGGTKKDTLEDFCDDLLETYLREFGGSRNAMFRMKEHWRYLIRLFRDDGTYAKRLRKVTDVDEYRSILRSLFQQIPLRTGLDPDW